MIDQDASILATAHVTHIDHYSERGVASLFEEATRLLAEPRLGLAEHLQRARPKLARNRLADARRVHRDRLVPHKVGVGERPPWKPWMRKLGDEKPPERALDLGPEGTVAMLRSMIDE